MEVCVLCEEGFDDDLPAQVREKGLKTLKQISNERELHELCRYVFFLMSIYQIHINALHFKFLS